MRTRSPELTPTLSRTQLNSVDQDADQTYSIIKKRDSTGFSKDVTAVLLIANITRCVFWLGSRFELRELHSSAAVRSPVDVRLLTRGPCTALLFQSLALIVAMLVLLFILLKYQKQSVADASEQRPLGFWQWWAHSACVSSHLTSLLIVSFVAQVDVWPVHRVSGGTRHRPLWTLHRPGRLLVVHRHPRLPWSASLVHLLCLRISDRVWLTLSALLPDRTAARSQHSGLSPNCPRPRRYQTTDASRAMA